MAVYITAGHLPSRRSCVKSASWKCWNEAIKKNSISENAFCKNGGDDNKPVQGSAGMLAVKKWAIFGLIMG